MASLEALDVYARSEKAGHIQQQRQYHCHVFEHRIRPSMSRSVCIEHKGRLPKSGWHLVHSDELTRAAAITALILHIEPS
jgi:hypothetical protein